MVSREKSRYYKNRLAAIRDKLAKQIDEKYPEIPTNYRDLIAAGAGRLKSEEEIRRVCGEGSRYSCPPLVEMLKIFDLNGEKTEADAREAKQQDAKREANGKLRLEMKRAEDLLMLGTEEQLLAKLEELEAQE